LFCGIGSCFKTALQEKAVETTKQKEKRRKKTMPEDLCALCVFNSIGTCTHSVMKSGDLDAQQSDE
jgi:hypothetical protein